MIAHLVFFKAKPDQKDRLSEVKARLEALPPIIAEIKQYEVGINEVESARAYDMSLYSQFDSYDTMQVYQQHPDHQAVLKLILDVMDNIYAVDYTLA